MQQALRNAALAAALVGGASAAQAVVITTGYTQNFDTLASTGATGTTLPAGFTFTEAGTSALVNTGYSVGDGSVNAADTYSFGLTGSSDRALGTLLSGTLASTLFATFTNGNETAITGLTVAYAGEQWRLGQANRGADRLDFAYSLDGTTYTSFSALNFSSPVTAGTVGALNGNLDANRTLVSSTLSGLNLASGATITFRWSDFNVTGSDDGLGIDDFSLTPVFAAAVPEPTTWAMLIGGFGVLGGMMRRRRDDAIAFA